MRVVIIITPGAPRRAKQKGRRRPERTAAVDRVRMKENVIAACGPRPVLDAHAVFPATRGGCSGIRVVESRGHGKPHAASTWFGTTGRTRSEEHKSVLQLLMRISYTVLCWKKKKPL